MYDPRPPKPAQRFFNLLWDTLLITKAFEFEVNRAPADCAAHLLSLSQPVSGFFNAVSRPVTVHELHRDMYSFELCFKRYGRGTSWNSARAVGVVWVDRETETTRIRGRVKVGITFLILLVTWLGMMSTFRLTSFARDAGWYLVISAISLFYLGCILADYGRLYHLLEDTFSARKSKRKQDE